MSIWDHKSKKRLRQYPKYNSPVPSVEFNQDGTRLAVGVSYTWEEGEVGAKTAERPAVWIKNVGEEVKVRCVYAVGGMEDADRILGLYSRRDGTHQARRAFVLLVFYAVSYSQCHTIKAGSIPGVFTSSQVQSAFDY